jgi:Domain of Unknown Function with PDB structure (DUF3857)
MKFSRWAAAPLLFFFAAHVSIRCLAADWPAASPEELKMTDEPQAPGAPAIYLFRQVDRDDFKGTEYTYVRIKILREEGRKYADVELEYVKDVGSIHDIQARTVRPDGTIVNFEGKPFDKTIVKTKGVRYLAKTFTIPDVQVGSIIEYSYLYEWSSFGCFLVFDSHWVLSGDLFTKHAKFSLNPNRCFTMRWTWRDLPPGAGRPTNDKGLIRLEVKDIPGFETEDYMPPENELKARVDFIYSNVVDEKDPTKYWKIVGKNLYEAVENFVGKHQAIEQAVSQIVAGSDPPEVRLQKLYARTQRIRNLSFEEEKTAQEQKREKLKDIHNVEDVWKRGYGDGSEITWLYLALVRAAGFEAYPVFVSRRNQYFFNQQLPDTGRLNDTVVLIKLNGRDLYLDPGTAFTPFGLLPWPETAVAGLKLDKEGGSWVTTSLPESSDSKIERNAELKLSDTGDLEGKLSVTFTGLEALWRRLEENNEDDADKKKFLEDEVRRSIPVAAELDLRNNPDWKSSSPTLVAEFDLKVPGWVSKAGRRQLIPVGLFSATEKHIFASPTRTHPIYFDFRSQNLDEITIDLPPGWQASVPSPWTQDGHVVFYSLKVGNDKGKLHLTRRLDLGVVLTDQKYYTALRNFFQAVRTSDEQQIVLQPVGAGASN